jgi:hypothetical protein
MTVPIRAGVMQWSRLEMPAKAFAHPVGLVVAVAVT